MHIHNLCGISPKSGLCVFKQRKLALLQSYNQKVRCHGQHFLMHEKFSFNAKNMIRFDVLKELPPPDHHDLDLRRQSVHIPLAEAGVRRRRL